MSEQPHETAVQAVPVISVPPVVPSSDSHWLGSRLMRATCGMVERDVSLAAFSRWRIGGRADYLVEPSGAVDLIELMNILRGEGAPFIVVGDTSNLLFDDAGFRGVVVRIGRGLNDLDIERGGRVRAGAGVWVPRFVRALIGEGLAGAQHAIGIPGTLGGLVVMNGGSQRKGIGDHVEQVTILDAQGVVRRIDRAACGFAYRTSAFQNSGAIVLAAEFRYGAADRGVLRREALAILGDRRRKFPKELPNCGSVFVSNPAMYDIVGPPGHAIELAGLKGMRLGQAEISPLHANFINNLGGARSADVLELIRRAREAVHARTGFHMDCEVRHVAPDGTMRMAHEAAAMSAFNERSE